MEIVDFLTLKGLNTGLVQKYEALCDFTLAWNEKINVTAIKDPREFMLRNVIDSLTAAGRPELKCAFDILDLGTGGGYPGLPLAIAYPEKNFFLVDAVGKKLKVVDDICTRLEIKNVKTLHLRAEDMAKDRKYRESFDLVLSRAVANMSTLSEYCLPLVRVDGSFIAYKTEAALDEIRASERALKFLGSETAEIQRDGIEGSGHILVICKKIKNTPSQYPRKSGIPLKQPL